MHIEFASFKKEDCFTYDRLRYFIKRTTNGKMHSIYFEGKMVGYFIIKFYKFHLRIYSIAITAPGKGLGTKAVEFIAALGVALKKKSIKVEVRQDNACAISFWQKNGFKEEGKRLSYYADGMDAIEMTKDISNARAGKDSHTV